MPTLKTEIFGSVIKINYEEGEKDRLTRVLHNFNKRL